MLITILCLAGGMLALIVSAERFIFGAAAVRLATELGVSDLVIGLTIVAVGTSLPELAASVTAEPISLLVGALS